MKTEELEEVMKEHHGLEFEYSCSTREYRGRQYRILGQFLQISDKEFDRWANSIDEEIDFSRMREKRFLRDFEEITNP
tara:strand:+ start:736 stop:969 length:234 start_codon:yes stop_codon:yes gene_type:complete